MKKFIAFILALSVCLIGCSALCESTATPAEPVLNEGEILMHGYKSTAAGYYIGVPAEWALVGADSYPEHLEQAYEIAGYTEVKSLHSALSAENDILFAFSSAGEQMVLNYGPSDGVTSDTLIDEMDDLKRLLASEYVGIVFDEESGSYTLKELIEILYIGAKYNGNEIAQYYMPVDKNIYIFTFVNVDEVYRQAVLSTFTFGA